MESRDQSGEIKQVSAFINKKLKFKKKRETQVEILR